MTEIGRISDAAITDARIATIDDPYLSAAISEIVEKMEMTMEYQEEYFRKRPVLSLLRKIGFLPDPYMPARKYGLMRYYQFKQFHQK